MDSLSILKFGGLIVSAVSGFLLLIYDNKIRYKGKLTLPGKIVIGTIIAGFIISVASQYKEISNDNEKERIAQKNNNAILEEIHRDMYRLDWSAITIDMDIVMNASNKLLANYNKRLLTAYKFYKQRPGEKLPAGVNILSRDGGRDSMFGLEIQPGSLLYPNEDTESDVSLMLIQMNLSIQVVKDSVLGFPDAGVAYHTEKVKPIIQCFIDQGENAVSIYTLAIKGLKADDNVIFADKSKFETLFDLANCDLIFKKQFGLNHKITSQEREVLKLENITSFSLHAGNHFFKWYKVSSDGIYAVDYHVKLPKDVLKDQTVNYPNSFF